MTNPTLNSPNMFDIIVGLKREQNKLQRMISGSEQMLQDMRHQVANLQFQLDALAAITGVSSLPAQTEAMQELTDGNGTGPHHAVPQNL